MQTQPVGASRRPKNTRQTYPHAASMTSPKLKPVTLLTREYLQRLVAAMVD